jgi:hypothetical protein
MEALVVAGAQAILHFCLWVIESSHDCDSPRWWHFCCSIINQNLAEPRLRNALRALSNPADNHTGSPASAQHARGVTLRLGGSLADYITYNVSGSGRTCSEVEPKINPAVRLGFDGGCLTQQRWDESNVFAADVGAELLFGINALVGRSLEECPHDPESGPVQCHTIAEAHDKQHPAPSCCTNWTGSWDPQQATALLRYSQSKGFPLKGLEFGNELAGPTGIEAHLQPDVYAEGFERLRSVVDDIWGSSDDRPLMIGPDSSFNQQWFDDFVHIADPDVVTTHAYTLGAGVDWQDAERKATDPTSLDRVIHGAIAANNTARRGVGAANRGLWVGEAGTGARTCVSSIRNVTYILDTAHVRGAGNVRACVQVVLTIAARQTSRTDSYQRSGTSTTWHCSPSTVTASSVARRCKCRPPFCGVRHAFQAPSSVTSTNSTAYFSLRVSSGAEIAAG